MKKENLKNLYASLISTFAFILWTMALYFIDVKSIGPQNSKVGFATINSFVHNLTGTNMTLYTATDWLGLIPIAVMLGFALLGLAQWIKRKNLKLVDYSIFVLGGFYIAVMAVYFLFEFLAVNYRPVLIEGFLEASYPSSTTMLVLCMMPTAIMQFNSRIKSSDLKKFLSVAITVFIIFMVVGRLISGVHWLSDIIGGMLISAGLVFMYRFISDLKLSLRVDVKRKLCYN